MPRRPSRPTRLSFEALEGRISLSADVSARLVRGVLTVEGTEAADAIRVSWRPAAWARPGAARPPGWIDVEGGRTVPSARVRRVVVDGRGGDDVVSVDLAGMDRVDAAVLGGPGDDRIEANGLRIQVDAGAGLDVVNGVPDLPGLVQALAAPVDDLARGILDATNAERARAGLPPFAVSPELQEAARWQADATSRLGRLEHDLPGTPLPTLADRAEAAGYPYALIAENLAYNYPDAASTVDGWMGSPGHRANLLDPELQDIGVAVARDARGAPYAVQVFGRRA